MGKNKVRKKRKVDELWFILVVAIFIVIFSMIVQENDEGLQEEAETILDELTNGDEHTFAVNGILQEEILTRISGMSYKELKDSLNVENDFCIYFEDESGNLVEIKDGLRSVGSDAIVINGRPCGE